MQNLFEEIIPEFLGVTKGKARFIIKRIPETWKNKMVKIEEIEEDTFWATKETLIFTSLGRNEIDHSNHELFTTSDPNLMYFCFSSSRYAKISLV